jgi:hypothetical protein
MKDSNNVTYNLTGKKIIPLNAPIGFANATPPTTLPFQPVEKGQSVAEGLCANQGIPYYNEDGTVNVNAVATTLKMILDMYNTISQPVALLSMGAIPEWSQSVIDNNGGYPKDFVIREYDTTGYWVYYQSLVDNNINPKPTLASHVGWFIIYSYKNTADGTEIHDIHSITAGSIFDGKKYFNIVDGHGVEIFNDQGQSIAYLASNGSLCAHYTGGYFIDVNMSKAIGNITRYGQDTGANWIKNRILTLANGTVVSMQNYQITANSVITIGYAGNTGSLLMFKEIPFVVFLPVSNQGIGYWRVVEITTGHITVELASSLPADYKFEVSVLAIGTLVGYVGDELAKIRAYKVTPYYNKLTKNQKQELDQYYVGLDETKDLTKVTAPAWLEAELDGKELT